MSQLFARWPKSGASASVWSVIHRTGFIDGLGFPHGEIRDTKMTLVMIGGHSGRKQIWGRVAARGMLSPCLIGGTSLHSSRSEEMEVAVSGSRWSWDVHWYSPPGSCSCISWAPSRMHRWWEEGDRRCQGHLIVLLRLGCVHHRLG